jgi:hypothetical protein
MERFLQMCDENPYTLPQVGRCWWCWWLLWWYKFCTLMMGSCVALLFTVPGLLVMPVELCYGESCY